MTRLVLARPLEAHERDAVLDHLAQRAQDNLFLLDLVARSGSPSAPGEARTQIAVVRRGDEIAGVAALRPSLVLDAGIEREALAALLPLVAPLGVGLIKSAAPTVDALWSQLANRGDRRALVDRIETAYALTRELARLVDAPARCRVRAALRDDLDALVYAARESLREEDRPDPFAGDSRSFRRWVRGRVERARVVECEGRVAFVGYADVQRREGWLLQGIYTWPEMRRRGLAAAGTSALCREAFARGARHVQLAVVEGNAAGRALYEGLGFKPFDRLRTILFA